LAESNGDLYADGGLFANAPDLVAAHEADYVFNVPSNKFRLLSVGTLSSTFSIEKPKGKDFGVFDWMRNGRLLEIMISAQGQFTTQMMRHRYGANYFRIDTLVPHSDRKLELDNASKEMVSFLIDEADNAVKKALASGLSAFLNHHPTTWKNYGKSQESILQ
jgi:hypothetical protein